METPPETDIAVLTGRVGIEHRTDIRKSGRLNPGIAVGGFQFGCNKNSPAAFRNVELSERE
jgi:hypothetical protein